MFTTILDSKRITQRNCFIRNLTNRSPNLRLFDRDFLNAYLEKNLTEHDSEEWWIDQFKQRYQAFCQVHETILHPTEDNLLWFRWGFDLARPMKISYLEILFPNQPKCDPNTLEPLFYSPAYQSIKKKGERAPIAHSYYYDSVSKVFNYTIDDPRVKVVLPMSPIIRANFERALKIDVAATHDFYIDASMFVECLKATPGVYPHFGFESYFQADDGSIRQLYLPKKMLKLSQNGSMDDLFLLKKSIKNKQISFVTRDHAAGRARAFSVYELKRLFSSNKIALWDGYHNQNNCRRRIGEYFKQSLPNLSKFGQPIHIIWPAFVRLMTSYLTKPSEHIQFQAEYKKWLNWLLEFAPRDVYRLYAQSFTYHNDSMLWIDFFIELTHIKLHETREFKTKILAFITLLFRSDLSLVLNHDQYYSFRREIGIGVESFDTIELMSILRQLSSMTPEVSEQITRIIQRIRERQKVDTYTLHLISQLPKQANLIERIEGKAAVKQEWMALFQRISSTYVLREHYLSVLAPNKKPLSLEALARIKSGATYLYYTILGKTYENFSYLFQRNIVSNALSEVHRPTILMLFDLVKLFYEQNASLQQLKVPFQRFLKFFYMLPVEKAHFFYMQSLNMSEGRVYIAELLLVLREAIVLGSDKANFNRTMYSLAAWFASYDASLIVRAPQLDDLYIALKVGPKGFTAKNCKKLLENCFATLPKQMAIEIRQPIIDESVDDISLELVQFIAAIYAKTRINYTVFDETCLVSDKRPWIKLAQSLYGAVDMVQYGQPKTYYRYMMPDVVYEYDPMTEAWITDHDLSHYVLHSDRLILIDDCIDLFDKKGIFAYIDPETRQPIMMNDTVYALFEHAGRPFYWYAGIRKYVQELESSLDVFSYICIKLLIQDGYFPSGVYFSGQYSAEEKIQADAAFQLFYERLSVLPDATRETLYRELIYTERKILTVRDVLSREKCMATTCCQLAHLCYQYVAEADFDQIIQGQLSHTSRVSRTFSGRDRLLECVKILLVQLMTLDHRECFECCEEIISIDGCENQAPSVLKKLFEHLMPLLDSSSGCDPFRVYIDAIEFIVNPEYKKNPGHSFLSAILDTRLFQKEKLYTSAEIITELERCALDPQSALFPDWQQIHTFCQNGQFINQYDEIKFNVLFRKLIHCMSTPSMTQAQNVQGTMGIKLSERNLFERQKRCVQGDDLISTEKVFDMKNS